MSKTIGSAMTYTNEDGNSVVIVYEHIQAIVVERDRGKVSLQIWVADGMKELLVPDEIARACLDQMGLTGVPLPKADE